MILCYVIKGQKCLHKSTCLSYITFEKTKAGKEINRMDYGVNTQG
jgi:hypothetical protein